MRALILLKLTKGSDFVKTKKLASGLLMAFMFVFAISGGIIGATATDVSYEEEEAPRVFIAEGEPTILTAVDVPENSNAPIMAVTTEDDGSIVPLDYGKMHISPTRITTGTDYNASFSCSKEDGNRMNVWVQNNGSSPVYLNVEWSRFFGLISKQYDSVKINAGSSYTMTFYYEDGSGIDGNWDINVTTTNGATLDINVSARQYQIN